MMLLVRKYLLRTLIACLFSGGGFLVTNTISASASTPQPSITFDYLPSVITLGTATKVEFSVPNLTDLANYEAYIAIYPRTLTRIGLAQQQQHAPNGYPIGFSRPAPLSTLATTAGASFRFSLELNGSTNQSISLDSCGNNCAGNYPVQLRIAKVTNGEVVAENASVLPVISGPATSRLNVDYLANYAPAHYTNSGLLALSEFLGSHESVPFNLAISGSVIYDALARQQNPGVKQALATLATWSSQANHVLVPTSFVPTTLACLPSGGGVGSALSQLQSTGSLFRQVQDLRFNKNIVDLPTGFNANNAEQAAKRGFRAIIVPGSYLSGLGLRLTLATPLKFDSTNTQVMGLDPLLGSEISSANSVINLSHVTSDLAQIYFEAPNSTSPRTVLGSLPLNTTYQRDIASEVFSMSLRTPFLQMSSLTSSLQGSSQSLSRSDLTLPSLTHSCDSKFALALKGTRSQLTNLSSAAPNAKVTATLSYEILSAESSLLSSHKKIALLHNIANAVGQQSSLIKIAAGAPLTLTARKTNIPLSITSKAGYPLSVIVKLSSQKLNFPQGSTRHIELLRQTSTLSFPVVVKALGSFPLSVTVSAPNGSRLTRAILGVRSSTFSLAGIILTAGALGVFLFWWAKNILATRSLRRRTADPIVQ